MHLSTQRILGAAAIVLLVATIIVANMAMQFVRDAKTAASRSEEMLAQARQAGTSLDSGGCIDRAIADYRKSPGMIRSFEQSDWLNACLETARRDRAVCPITTSNNPFGRNRELLVAQDAFCKRHMLTDDVDCQFFWEEVYSFCFISKG